MTSREAVRAALNHREPDRVPIDFGSTAVTGMHVECVAALRNYYGLERRPVKVHEPYQMLGLIEEDLKDALGVTTSGVFPRKTMFGFANEKWKEWRFRGLDVLVPGDFNVTTDANGDTLIYPEGDLSAPPSGRMPKDGVFFDTIIRQQPFTEEELDPAANLEEFSPIGQEDLDYFARAVAEAEATGRAVVANFGGTGLGDIALVPGPFMKYPKGIRDVAEWYISTRTRPNYVKAIFEKQTDIALTNLQRIHAVVGDRVDVVMTCGTDFGTQRSTFCSPDAFRDLYLPYYRKVNDWIRANTSWKIFKHSCGSVETFIDAFLEAGFDILNPVQCSAARMEAEHLKSVWGGRLVFWGGGVDTQKTLPFGSAAQVREQVLRRCEVFARGGGFVFNSIHNVQAGTPVANIVAMIDAVREFSGVR